MAKKKHNKNKENNLLQKFMVGGKVNNYITDPQDALYQLEKNKAQAMLEGESDFLGNAFGILSDLSPMIMGAISGKNGNQTKINLPGAEEAMVEKAALGGTIGPNAEVEGGEIGLTPEGQVLDFQGPSHEAGGIPVSLPDGTEMFSKRIKIDGESIANQMKKKAKNAGKFKKKADKEETDQIVKNTQNRVATTLAKDVERFKEIQEAFQNAQAEMEEPLDIQKFALGGRKGILDNLPGYDNTLLNNEFQFDQSLIDSVQNAITEDLKNTNSNQPVPEVLSPTTDNVTPTSTTNASNATAPQTKSVLDTLLGGNGLGSVTAGDAMIIYDTIKRRSDLKKNILENRAGDAPNINPYENYGQDALNTIDNMAKMQEIQRQSALNEAYLQRNANIPTGRSMAQDRAFQLAGDMAYNTAANKINASNADAVQKMLGIKANAQLDVDKMRMTGEASKDMNDRRDRDAYFQNMNAYLQSPNPLGSYLNQMKSANIQEKLVNLLSKHGVGVKNGKLVSQNNGAGTIPTDKIDSTAVVQKVDEKITAENKEARENSSNPNEFSILSDTDKINIAQNSGYTNVSTDRDGNVWGDVMEVDSEGNMVPVRKMVLPFQPVSEEMANLFPLKKGKKSGSLQGLESTTKSSNSVGSNKFSGLDSFKKRIAGSESKGTGDYKAHNPSGTGAYGRYQFKWRWHGDAIQRVTGVKSAEEFKSNKKAQEKYMNHHLNIAKNVVSKKINQIQAKMPEISFDDAMMLYHYEPANLDKIINGTIKSLDYVPGSKEKNMSLGRYLYGNKYKGKKTN